MQGNFFVASVDNSAGSFWVNIMNTTKVEYSKKKKKLLSFSTFNNATIKHINIQKKRNLFFGHCEH